MCFLVFSFFLLFLSLALSFAAIFLKDYEHLGRVYCETLMDFSDDNPTKVIKLKKTLKKMRKLERRRRRLAKQQSTTTAAAAVDGDCKSL